MKHTIDLHMHSMYSTDGEFSPRELVLACKNAGITVMAIADHNCVRANEEGLLEAQAAGLTYIPAIEIDCTFEGVNLHVLGYGIDYKSDDFKKIEENISSQNVAASFKMLEATRALGFHVVKEDLEALEADMFWKTQWTGEMFAEILLDKPEYKDHPLLLPYRDGGSRSDNPYVNFYWDYYSQGKPCYTPVFFPALEEIIEIIHKNGGKAVLAHPGVNLKGREALFEQIIAKGIDGAEAFSSYHTEEQSEYFCRHSRDAHLFVTCGSDYHGKTKPAISLGDHGCTIDDEELLRTLPFYK